MKELHLVMPMAGGGTRFAKQGFAKPKPLIEIYGKPFFYWATQSIVKNVAVAGITFVVLANHVKNFDIDRWILEFYPKAKIEVIPKVLPGAVLTCMQGIKHIEDNTPIIFNDCDHLFLCREFYDFCEANKFATMDGGLITFKSQDARYSYAAYYSNGNVCYTVEKQVVSEDAICGAYYFRNLQVFEEAVRTYLKNCNYAEYFVSGVYNELIKAGGTVKTFNADDHVSFGTPDEYELAKGSYVYRSLI